MRASSGRTSRRSFHPAAKDSQIRGESDERCARAASDRRHIQVKESHKAAIARMDVLVRSVDPRAVIEARR